MRKKSLRGRLGFEPNPIDIHVGSRLRMYRMLRGLSQGKLGEALGLTFQQIQKYEKGLNRVGASRLWDICQVLDIPVAFLYEGISNETKNLSPRNLPIISPEKLPLKAAQAMEKLEEDPLTRRETLELIRAYYTIADRDLAQKMLDLMKSLAFPDGEEEED